MKRNFPSFLEAFLKYSQNVGAPEKFLLWSAISGISAALERKVWVRYETQYIYPNQFIMLIADSGIARKSTSIKPIVGLLKKVDSITNMSTQLSAASLVSQLKEAGDSKTFDWNGTSYKNSSLFCSSSEAKTTIGEKNGLDGVQTLLTDFYDCGEIGEWSLLPAWSKKTMGAGKTDIFNPCLNLLACSTSVWLNECIGSSGIEGGFASRVLFVVLKEKTGKAVGWIDESQGIKKDHDAKALVEDLKQINQLRGNFQVSATWKSVFNAYQIEFEDKAAEGGLKKSYYARKLWHCLKLAQVLAADQSNDMILTGEHLEAARGLLETIEPDMYSPFSLMGDNKDAKPAAKVWSFMVKKKSWDKKDLHRITFNHASMKQLNDILHSLVMMKKVRMVPIKDGSYLYEVIDATPLGE